jgi:energy-coupling factor transporter ATP-binding protein EcfA2
MHLSNIGLVNWHLFPLLDIPVTGQVIGISGENKSGKSTILDAIQTVMTGGDQKAMDLNRAAAEGGKGGHRRTLHAYCLGRLSKDHVRREASSTTIVLSFRDPFGLQQPVSIGVSVEAELSSNAANVVSRFIVKGVEIKASDIVLHSAEGLQVEPWRDSRRRLEALVMARGGTFADYHDSARDFVKEYMFALFEKGRAAVPSQYVRSFVNAVAFREMESANDFVRKYLLEEEPIQIGALRRSIQVYRDADKQVKELNAQLQLLQALESKLEELAELEKTAHREEWIALRAKAVSAVQLHNATFRGLKAALSAIAEREGHKANASSEIGRINDEIGAISLERSAALSEERQARLKAEISLIDKDLENLRRPVSGMAVAMRNLSSLRPLADLEGLDGSTFDRVDEAVALIPGELDTSFPRDPERLDAIVIALKAQVASVEQAAQRLLKRIQARELELEQKVRDLKAQIEAARTGKAVLTPATEAMIRRLSSEGMRPRVLAELVDIGDERWADAAEGYLGVDREAILVDPQHCHAATEILSRERANFRQVRIANTRKLASMDTQAAPGTLASVFRSSDALAKAFVVFRTGNIRLGSSRSDLDKPGRWILDDGTYDDGVVIDVKEPRGGRKLGARGLEVSAERAAAELAKVAGELTSRQQDTKIAERWIRFVERFSELLEGNIDRRSFTEIDALAVGYLKRVDELNAAIESLASADVSAFDEQLALARKNLKEAEEERSECEAELRALSGKKGGFETTLGKGEDSPGSRLHALNSLRRFRQGRTKLGVVDPIASYRSRRASQKSVNSLAEDAIREAASAREDAAELRSECELEARECLVALNQADLFGLRPSLFTEVRPWMRERIDEIRNETLVEYEAELANARQKTNDIFRNSFANELAARFAKVDAELRDIRDVLRKYDFLDERYNFRSSRAPGYEAFHAIVERLRELELADVPLFQGDVKDEHPLAEELRIVEAVLLSDDVDIEQYEDYRRYFSFELEITSLSSGRTVPWSERKGTASGGETQTPYYVALLSALSSIYYGGARSRLGGNATGLCLAAFDEAFSKLDETVRYEMVTFCQELGLQLLICGPDGGRQSMERYAHTIVDVWRRGDESYARSDLILQRTRDELAAIDPAKLTRAELEAMMTEAANQ